MKNAKSSKQTNNPQQVGKNSKQNVNAIGSNETGSITLGTV